MNNCVSEEGLVVKDARRLSVVLFEALSLIQVRRFLSHLPTPPSEFPVKKDNPSSGNLAIVECILFRNSHKLPERTDAPIRIIFSDFHFIFVFLRTRFYLIHNQSYQL